MLVLDRGNRLVYLNLQEVLLAGSWWTFVMVDRPFDAMYLIAARSMAHIRSLQMFPPNSSMKWHKPTTSWIGWTVTGTKRTIAIIPSFEVSRVTWREMDGTMVLMPCAALLIGTVPRAIRPMRVLDWDGLKHPRRKKYGRVGWGKKSNIFEYALKYSELQVNDSGSPDYVWVLCWCFF